MDTVEQCAEAIEAGAELILLDNMSPDELRDCVVLARPAGRRLEASGGLTLDDAAEVAATGVDYLAVGALTHSAPVLDIGLDLTRDLSKGAEPLMLLAIDIGNTNTVLGVFDGERIVHSWRVKTDARNTADELMLTFTACCTGCR